MRKYFILAGGLIVILGILGYVYYKYNKTVVNVMDCELCGYYFNDKVNHYDNDEIMEVAIPNPRPYLKVTDTEFITYLNKVETIYQYKLNKGIMELYIDEELKMKYSYSFDNVRLYLSDLSMEEDTVKYVNVYQKMESDAFLNMVK